MSLSPGSTLGPYEIRSQLGQGGMGVVYLAQDPRLKRQVAIKLLPPDLTRDTTAKQRFLQEAQAASALDHPNICTIFEINETADGQLYLVMAHYAGETLKERIARGPLPLDEAVGIATQVGQGLAKAHAAGIVHRDIKPANLMVTADGTVKILDFGLAKLVGVEGVTQTAATVGTVAYMSPEQARGADVDHRTDIWSFGVVFYELLTGKLPFDGDNLLAIAEAISQREPPALVGRAASLNSFVSRALQKVAGRRYQAINDVLAALRAPRETGAPITPTVGRPDQSSIAVLPFDNVSADPEQQYLCEGMADEIIGALGAMNGLRVAARTSTLLAKAKGLDIAEIGARLKVGAVLDGSVRRSGNRLRVTVQLINASDGYQLWSERFDRELVDVFAVQDEIARAVTETLTVKLVGADSGPMVRPPTDDLAAYNSYLKGRYYYVRASRPALEKALECFARALAIDGGYGRAHAGIGLAEAARAVLGLAAPRQVMPRALDAALAAIGIDGTMTDAHVALAMVRHWFEWDWAGAEQEYAHAIALNPDDALARSYHGQLLAVQGFADDAIAEARRGVELDPLAPYSRFQVPLVLCLTRRFEDALTEAQVGVELEPNHLLVHWNLGWALAGLGRLDEAAAAFRQATVVAPADPVSLGYLGWALGVAGNRDEARTIRDELERRRTREYFSGWLMAHLSLGAGDHERAITWLETAAEERDGLLTFLKFWCGVDPLRADPRFQALLRRMNFPETAASG